MGAYYYGTVDLDVKTIIKRRNRDESAQFRYLKLIILFFCIRYDGRYIIISLCI